MSKIRTLNKIVTIEGKLRLLESKGLLQKVELLLLNSKVNRNNWQYLNLSQHRALFAETPILCAYVGTKIGDGHNFEEIRDENGDITASFMSATAERIVGYIKSENDVTLVDIDGTEWIKAIGYLWTWYANELSEKLKRQGLDGMEVSIETLIEKGYKDNGVEVFTKWLPLGTTILGDDVSPAVAGATIKTLSAITKGEMKEITLKVASAYETENTSKGANTMELEALKAHFEGYSVLASEGNNVVLLSEDGKPFVNTFAEDGENIVIGEYVNLSALLEARNAVATLTDENTALKAEKEALNASLETEKAEREKAEGELLKLQALDIEQKKDKVKSAVLNRLAEINKNSNCPLAGSVCDELITDESLDKYAHMTDCNGDFCGDIQACKDVDCICMNKIIEFNGVMSNGKFDLGKVQHNSSNGKSMLEKAIENTEAPLK